MNRTKAWRTLAIAFDTPRPERTVLQRNLTASGLCWGLMKLNQRRCLMRLFKKYGFWWPRTVAGDANRAVFAGLMAAMDQRERDKLVKGL